jgi:hypothetical protein
MAVRLLVEAKAEDEALARIAPEYEMDHYLSVGTSEGRASSSVFDVQYDLSQYGRHEGRNGAP